MKKIFYSIMALAIAAMTFQSCEDVPMPYDMPGSEDKPTVVEPAGTGTKDDPYNIAGILEATESLNSGENLPEKVYFKGVVTSVKECSPSYGNATFYLGDDIESSKTFYVYQCLGLGNKNITSEDEVQVGDTITIYGTVTNYNGTIETAKKEAYIYESSRGGSSGPAEEAIEITCAKAIELCNALADGASSTETYSITGYITDVYSTISYNQQSFWLSDNNDGQKMVQAYWANLPQGVEAFTKGSKVKITGKLLKYKNSSNEVITEVKNADVEIIEQGSSTPDIPTGDAKHITISEFLSKKDSQTTYELTGTVKNIANTTYGNFDLVEGDTKIYIYGLLDKDGNAKNFASLGISEGDEVTLTGVYSEYNTSPQIKNAQFVSVKKGSGGGTGENNPPTGDGMTAESLKAGKACESDLPTNSYGSQTYNIESTWYAWKYDNITYKGSRICAANGDFTGCIQVQGNASDVSKQGFLFNETPFSSEIKSVVLVVKGKATYDTPTEFSVYGGSAAHPTTNIITAQTKTETGSTLNTFTMTFDFSNGNYKYFHIWNNAVGALYIEKIIVSLK